MADCLRSLGRNLGVAALFYLWQFHDYQWCGNVVLFFLWCQTVVFILCGILKDLKPAVPENKAQLHIQTTSTLVFVLWLAAIGYFVTAGFVFTGSIAWTAFNARAKKEA